MTVQVGVIIDDKYRVVRLLGEGGMGAVYEGENLRIKRRVAIKVLHAELAKQADVVTRFEREAQAAGRIGSDHIVDVLDLGDLPDGDLYMVMEFLEGESLDARIHRLGRMSARELCPIALQLLDGLADAHRARIIHRDLKPDNVFLTPDPKTGGDFVKILDFGISKFRSIEGDHNMTRTGAIMGTPYFLSPEQARGNVAIDERVDVYAVGVILYYALSGSVPFDSDSFTDLLFKIALEDPPPLATLSPGVTPDVVAIVQKAMARERDERYPSAEALAEDLAGWLRAQGIDPDRSGALPAADASGRLPRVHATPPTLVQMPTPDALHASPAPPGLRPAATTPGLSVSQAEAPKGSRAALAAGAAAAVILMVAVLAVVFARNAPESAAVEPTPAAQTEEPREPEAPPEPPPEPAPATEPSAAASASPEPPPPSPTALPQARVPAWKPPPAPAPAPKPKPKSTSDASGRKFTKSLD